MDIKDLENESKKKNDQCRKNIERRINDYDYT